MREKFTNSFNETDCDFGNMSGECLNKYTGSHCLNIINYAECGSTARTTADAYVSNAVMDQKGVEDLVDTYLFALDFYINPSDECREALVPLLCLYHFGHGGTYNTDYRPTAAECREVKIPPANQNGREDRVCRKCPASNLCYLIARVSVMKDWNVVKVANLLQSRYLCSRRVNDRTVIQVCNAVGFPFEMHCF